MILLKCTPVVHPRNLNPTLIPALQTVIHQCVLYCRCVTAAPGGEGAARGPMVCQEDETGHVSATAHVRAGSTRGKVTSG